MNIQILIQEIFIGKWTETTRRLTLRKPRYSLRALNSKQALARWTEEKVASHVKCLCFTFVGSEIFLQATKLALDLVLWWMSIAKSHRFPLYKCFLLACPSITMTVISSFFNEITEFKYLDGIYIWFSRNRALGDRSQDHL